MAAESKLLTFSVTSRRDVSDRIGKAFRGIPQGHHISFATPELLWRTLTERRWQLLRTMAGAGPLSIREVARRAGRDVKAVHGDVTALLAAGVIERSEAGVEFPYQAIHVDFTVEAA